MQPQLFEKKLKLCTQSPIDIARDATAKANAAADMSDLSDGAAGGADKTTTGSAADKTMSAAAQCDRLVSLANDAQAILLKDLKDFVSVRG